MVVTVTHIGTHNQSLIPALIIDVEIESSYSVEMPVFISGVLITTGDSKIISLLNESQISNDSTLKLRVLSSQEKQKLYNEKSIQRYYAKMLAILTPAAIEHIENRREMDNEKSVHFNVSLLIKHMELPLDSQNIVAHDLIKLNVRRYDNHFTIKQSDWIRHYAPQLGIGNFMLLELQIPNNKKVSAFWENLYTKLTHNLKDMENSLRTGDWQKTMFMARKFYENIKIGDSKPAHKKFKTELDKLLARDQHSKEGIENLYDAIWKFFEYVSKYVHDKDKSGDITPLPVSTKEDAYFAYSLALGLLNMIGKKISIE